MQNVRDCLNLARQIHQRGLEDLSKAVDLLQQHQRDTERIFGTKQEVNLKFCQVYTYTHMHAHAHLHIHMHTCI